MMPWSMEPVTRLFTVADRCRNTSRRPGFTETEHCCRPLSREHLYNTAADRCPAKITWVINWHHCSEHCCIMADRCPANTDQTHAEQAPSSNDACTVNVCAIDQQSVRVGVPGRELCCPPCARAARSPRCAGPWNGVPRLRCRENVGQAREGRPRTINANWRALPRQQK